MSAPNTPLSCVPDRPPLVAVDGDSKEVEGMGPSDLTHLRAQRLLVSPVDEQAMNGRLAALGVREALSPALGAFGGRVGRRELFAAVLPRIGEVHVRLGLEPFEKTALVEDVTWALAVSLCERKRAERACAKRSPEVS